MSASTYNNERHTEDLFRTERFVRLVRRAQERLVELGYLPAVDSKGRSAVDGYLGPDTERALDALTSVFAAVPPPAHLDANGYRDGRGSRARPMAEAPPLTGLEPDLGIKLCYWLDVERSQRWLPRDGSTYCNVYAADFVYLYAKLRGVELYLPRVWWYPDALESMERGEEVFPVYARTVREMNANSLNNWLEAWGEQYGWRVVEESDLLLETQRSGRLGVVVARRKANAEGRRYSGHVSIVLPSAAPSQSQAGGTNRERFWSRWWDSSRFDSVVMAVEAQ